MDKITRQRRKEIYTLGMVVEANKLRRQLFVCDNGVMYWHCAFLLSLISGNLSYRNVVIHEVDVMLT